MLNNFMQMLNTQSTPVDPNSVRYAAFENMGFGGQQQQQQRPPAAMTNPFGGGQ